MGPCVVSAWKSGTTSPSRGAGIFLRASGTDRWYANPRAAARLVCGAQLHAVLAGAWWLGARRGFTYSPQRDLPAGIGCTTLA